MTGGRDHAVGDRRGFEALAADHMHDHGAVERCVERAVILEPLREFDDALRDALGRRRPVALENGEWMEQRLLQRQLPLLDLWLIADQRETGEAFFGEGKRLSSGKTAGGDLRGGQEMLRRAP